MARSRGFVQILDSVVEEELDKLATRIQYELKRACPKRTGEAAASIHIEMTDKYSRFVGADTSTPGGLALYYADQGNGGRGTIIKPKRAKALPITNKNGQWIAFRSQVHGYEGSHFVKAVADKHR